MVSMVSRGLMRFRLSTIICHNHMALRAHTHTHTRGKKREKTEERAHSLVQQVGVFLVGDVQIEHSYRALEFEQVRRRVSEQIFDDTVAVSVF